jgi:hypothetical protein
VGGWQTCITDSVGFGNTFIQYRMARKIYEVQINFHTILLCEFQFNPKDLTEKKASSFTATKRRSVLFKRESVEKVSA